MFFKSDVQKDVKKILKGFSGIRRYKVLNDVTLSYKGKTAHIDCMMVGYFGILFVNAVDIKKAQLFGSEYEEKWAIVDKNDKRRINNIYKETVQFNAFLRDVFSNESIYSIPFENAICIKCKDDVKQINANVNAMNILTPKQLKKYIRRVKFEKDLGVDVDRIVQCIDKYSK